MTFDGRTATSLVMFLLFAGASILAIDLPAKAAFMPLLIGIPGTILCLWQLVSDLRRAPEPEKPAVTEDESGGQSELAAFIWLGIFLVVLLCFGFIVGAPLVVTAFIRFSSRESWSSALFAGAGTFVMMYGVFIWLLELSIFEGLVIEWLF